MRTSKSFVLLSIAFLVTVSAFPMEELLEKGFKEVPHKFGGIHLQRETSHGFESHVKWPKGGLFSEQSHFDDFRKTWIAAEKDRENFKAKTEEDLLACSRSEPMGFFKFLPTLVATLNASQPNATFSSPCFKNNTVQLVFVDNTTVQVIHNKSGGHFACGDAYLYTSIANYHNDVYYLPGTHSVTFHVSAQEWNYIHDTGILIFRYCDRVVDELPDFLKTLILFVGGTGLDPNIPFIGSKPTEYQIEQNIKFIEEGTGYTYEKRPENATKTVVQLNQSLINSGDFLAIIRFDGLDEIIEWGAGSHAGHSTMALWVDDELYVVESQSGWYWPRRGIQMNPFDQWVQWANDADFMVTWLPLKPEYAAQFNETAAWEWFQTVEGTPYGYHNFLFGWIDTPNASYPSLLSPEFIAPLFAIVESISPLGAQAIFTEACNKRLGTQNLTVAEIAFAAYEAGYTMPDLYAIPEQDGWWYSDGLSYVCSSFVIAMWKAAGLFDGFEINAVEFTPRDIYQSVMIDPAPPVPENCQSLDPTNPYCQIMGTWRMQFPGISTVETYDHMNEHCPSIGPNYTRTPGC